MFFNHHSRWRWRGHWAAKRKSTCCGWTNSVNYVGGLCYYFPRRCVEGFPTHLEALDKKTLGTQIDRHVSSRLGCLFRDCLTGIDWWTGSSFHRVSMGVVSKISAAYKSSFHGRLVSSHLTSLSHTTIINIFTTTEAYLVVIIKLEEARSSLHVAWHRTSMNAHSSLSGCISGMELWKRTWAARLILSSV